MCQIHYKSGGFSALQSISSWPMVIFVSFFFFNFHYCLILFMPIVHPCLSYKLSDSLCLSLLACNASWVELWSKHQDNRKQKAMEKQQSKTFHTKKTGVSHNCQLLISHLPLPFPTPTPALHLPCSCHWVGQQNKNSMWLNRSCEIQSFLEIHKCREGFVGTFYSIFC